LRYHPPFAGAIFWERQLYYRMKNTILIFQEIEEMQTSDLKAFTFEQYTSLAEQMKNYEDAKFDEFVNKTNPILQSTMRRSILSLQPYERKPGEDLYLKIIWVR
jgi:dynein heavy chain